MFDTFIDGLHRRYAPLAERCAGSVADYAKRTLTVLEDIRENTDNPQFQEVRYPIFAQLNAANGRLRTIDVPQYEDWELDYIAVSVTGASTVTIRQGGFLLYANNFANPQTASDLGAVVRGGTQLQLAATADAEVTLIFVAEVPKKTGRANPRAVGEEQFAGLQGTEGGAEPERHLAVGLDMSENGGNSTIGTNNQR